MQSETITVPKPPDDVISGKRSTQLCEPWILPEALARLKELVCPDFRVFEWGSGGSTVWFAQRCRQITSIETNLRWYIWTQEQLAQRGLDGTRLYFLPRLCKGQAYSETKGIYAGAIEAFPNAHFDLIFVDGEAEAREICVEAAVPKVKPDGCILWDNSNVGEGLAMRDGGGWRELMFITPKFEWRGNELQLATSFFWRALGRKEL